jgi:hypothetical protein
MDVTVDNFTDQDEMFMKEALEQASSVYLIFRIASCF